jgi:glycosyltransferase involved in cell wall biosynthesis
MHKKKTVIISSVSDCREKNGIVTFIKIFAHHASHFADHGIELAFSNYVDLGSYRMPSTPVASPAVFPPTTPHSPNFLTRLKRSVKGHIVRRPILAFLLFLSTLGVRGLVTALKARRYDEPGCVHFYQDFLTASFGCFLHHKTARRVIVLHSGDDSLRHLFIYFSGMVGTRYERLVRSWFDWTLRHQQSIVTLSEKYAKDLRRHYPAQVIRCIYSTSLCSGIGTAARAVPEEKSRIKLVAVGSLQYIKGFDLLINAIAIMPYAEREKLDLTIVGGGPSHVELAEMVVHHKLSHIITLAGESNNVATFLEQSDAYILTSRDEGLPISLIEACSFSLPIISTAVGSIPEVFDDSSCKLMEPTEASIADALMSLCGDRFDLENLSLQSQRVFASKFSPEKFLSSYISLLAGE